MKCPIDGATLAMAERHGVEIDYCPECRGIWLDRGELDRIIEAAAPGDGPRGGGRDHDDRPRHDEHEQRDRDDDSSHRRGEPKRKSRFSMLSDMLGGAED